MGAGVAGLNPSAARWAGPSSACKEKHRRAERCEEEGTVGATMDGAGRDREELEGMSRAGRWSSKPTSRTRLPWAGAPRRRSRGRGEHREMDAMGGKVERAVTWEGRVARAQGAWDRAEGTPSWARGRNAGQREPPWMSRARARPRMKLGTTTMATAEGGRSKDQGARDLVEKQDIAAAGVEETPGRGSSAVEKSVNGGGISAYGG
jgi:hypothetical protein